MTPKNSCSVVVAVVLFGKSGKRAEQLTASALLLGWKLQDLKKALEKRGATCERLLVTLPGALCTEQIQALAQVWSIRFLDEPVVHKDRLKDQSGHLTAEGISSTAVWLKASTLDLADSELVLILDADNIPGNMEECASKLMMFLPGGVHREALLKCGVCALSHDESTMHSPFQTTKNRSDVHVSYAGTLFAGTRMGNAAFLKKYRDKMASPPPPSGNKKLSDQSLLQEMVGQQGDGFVLMPQEWIMFPSWSLHHPSRAVANAIRSLLISTGIEDVAHLDGAKYFIEHVWPFVSFVRTCVLISLCF